MNLFFGAVTRQGIDFKNIKAKINMLYDINSSSYTSKKQNVYCGYYSTGGRIIGMAQEDGVFLIYIGSLYKPMPGWETGSPLDDPDVTATFLLHRYKERGKAFMDNVLGTYDFFLFDEKNDLSMVGSDPDGSRKLFYYYKNQCLFFSTTLISIQCFFENKLTIDRSFEDFLLGYEFLPYDRTMIKDVFCLQKGTILEVMNNEINIGEIKSDIVEEQNVITDIPENITETELIDYLYRSFLESIEDVCPTRSPIAVLLGGVDSALIASILKKGGHTIETFTFSFDDKRYNQANVDILCNYLDIEHNWISINPDLIRDGLDRYSLNYNQVTGLPHYLIQTTQTCLQMKKKDFHYCLTGDGCDEVFLGYPSVHKRATLFMNLAPPKKILLSVLFSLLSFNFIEKYFGHPARFLRNFVQIAGRGALERGHISNRTFDEVSLKKLCTNMRPIQAMDVETILSSLVFGLETLSPLRLAYHGKSMPGLNKNKHEGASNTTGVNILSPFLHPRVKNLGNEIPEAFLRPSQKTESSNMGKYIFLKMIEKYNLLPNEIIYQKKASPVASPVDYWYYGKLKSFMLDAVKGLPFEYNKKYVENLLRPKFTEGVFRDLISIGNYTSNAISLLATYASFTKHLKTDH